MNIWITGSSGFIGSHLLENLLLKGYQVSCFSNNRKLLEDKGNLNQSAHYLDFSSTEDMNNKIDTYGCPEIFVHLGWGDMTIPMSDFHLSGNVDNSNKLIKNFFLRGLKKFIFVGSMNEYGSRTGPLSEKMKPEGRLIHYAKGKLKVSQYGFETAAIHNKTFIHVRPFYVYGPGQRDGSLINDVFDAFTRGTLPTLGPCNYYRDYIHVKDVAEGICRTMGLESSSKINLGIGSYIMVQDFVKTFWNILGGDSNDLIFGSKEMMKDEPDQPKSYADITNLIQLTGWKPEYSIEEGIRETISILKKNRK